MFSYSPCMYSCLFDHYTGAHNRPYDPLPRNDAELNVPVKTRSLVTLQRTRPPQKQTDLAPSSSVDVHTAMLRTAKT